MTHKDIYTKFMIEYDKANVTSSYPSLTEYEVATVLDKAYNALIAQKVTGNNVRRIALEGDLKNISDLSSLIKQSEYGQPHKVDNLNVVYRDVPEDMLYYISGQLFKNAENPMDEINTRPLPIKLVNHEIADKFIISAYNMPWIKTPVCYIEDDKIYVVYDSVNQPELGNNSKMNITYIKTPNRFAKPMDYEEVCEYFDYYDPKTHYHYGIDDENNSQIKNMSYFDYELISITDEMYNREAYEEVRKVLEHFYTFECNDTVAEELISLAVAFALENVESQRLNSKLNMRGLEA